ncbi:MAG: hypothetical protein R2939_21990 [Kofleriaceae bacterium]
MPGDSAERLRATGLFGRLVVTDSHPRAHALRSPFVEVVGIAPLLADHLQENR